MEKESTADIKESFFDTKLKVITGLLALIIFGIPVFYYCNFSVLSESQEKWGQFGDFFGGVLNPIIAIANLGFLIYLTYIIKHRDDKADEKALEVQRNIALNQFRYDAYVELQKYINSFQDFPNTFQKMKNQYHQIATGLDNFDQTYGYIFEDDNYNKLIKDLMFWATSVAFDCSQLENFTPPQTHPKDVITDLNNIAYNKFRLNCSSYSLIRMHLLSALQHNILNKPFSYSTMIGT